MRYAVVIERLTHNYSAYVPDLPGCVVTASTLDEIRGLLREAISLHIDGLRSDGLEIPAPTAQGEYVEIEG
jgi:predicted RNase H-like HicB family nuclease